MDGTFGWLVFSGWMDPSYQCNALLTVVAFPSRGHDDLGDFCKRRVNVEKKINEIDVRTTFYV